MVDERTNVTIKQGEWSAIYAVSGGMNLMSCKKGEIELVDQSTRPLFEERFAGLGAMIGPHFHHRKPEMIPPVAQEERFPHIAMMHARGSTEPFSHGIARYAPWTVIEQSDHSLKAELKGDDLWEDVRLKDLEGQDFKMSYTASFTSEGLEILLSVDSETESVVGLHTYYSLAGGGTITTRVQDQYNDQGTLKPIDSSWNYSENHELVYPVDRPTDFGFSPFPDPLHGAIDLKTAAYTLRVQYWSENEENSFQIWHPEDASFVCIEPLSAREPRKPKLSVSSLKILISIL